MRVLSFSGLIHSSTGYQVFSGVKVLIVISGGSPSHPALIFADE